jgi:hypothetical protein
MHPAHLCDDERRYIRHKVEAENPALRKSWAPKRARGAISATGYLYPPTQRLGEKGSWSACVLRLLLDTPYSEDHGGGKAAS